MKHRIGIEDLLAGFEQTGYELVEFPDLTLGTTAKFGRVEDNALIFRAAANFTLDKFEGIVNDPANGQISQAGKRLVLVGPGDNFSRGGPDA